MTTPDKLVINMFVDRTNKLLAEEFRLTTKWYECEYNGHTVALDSPTCKCGTTTTDYVTASSWIDGYAKGINTAYKVLQGSNSHDLAKA